MNSIIKKTLSSLCLLSLLGLASCASTNSREIAQEHKSDEERIKENKQAPQQFHSSKFDRYNEF